MSETASSGEPQAQRQAEPKPDTRQCRICFAGVEEEPELGRLIKPCRCKGSIRYVHVKCIDTWRKTGSSLNSNSFWACPQCGFHYAFARTKILGLSTSPWVLGPTTVALFLLIVFAASCVVSYFVPELDDPMLVVSPPGPELDLSYTWWHSPLGIASEVIKETVHTFAEVSTPREVLEAHRLEILRNVEDTTLWGRFKRRLPVKASSKRRVVQRRDPRAPYSPSEDGPRVTFWARLARKFMLGLSLVGILSFLNLLITMSLFAPLQIARARWIRGRRETAGARDIGTILIIVFVLIGVIRALWGVYTTTRMLAQWVLLRAENAILEVQDDEDEEEEVKDSTNEKVDGNSSEAPALEEVDVTAATTSVQPQAEGTGPVRRPAAINTSRARARAADDDFGDELPATPGGWRPEWDWP